LKWRQWIIFASASLRHNLAALRELLTSDLSQAMPRVRRKSLRLLRRFWSLVSRGKWETDPVPAPAESEIDVSRTYREAVCSYIPRRYEGKVFLLRQSEPDPEIQTTDPSFNWKTAAKNLTVYVVPGGHFTAITVYSNLTVLTERLQACLDEAEARA
jgi:thioesterase domain-containing protein